VPSCVEAPRRRGAGAGAPSDTSRGGVRALARRMRRGAPSWTRPEPPLTRANVGLTFPPFCLSMNVFSVAPRTVDTKKWSTVFLHCCDILSSARCLVTNVGRPASTVRSRPILVCDRLPCMQIGCHVGRIRSPERVSSSGERLYNIVVLPKRGVFALNLAAVRDFLENGCRASFLYLTR